MDFNSPASLRFYSSVKVAALLFCRQDFCKLQRSQQHLIGWMQVQDFVTMKVHFLQLPENIQESVLELIQPIGDQIRRWLSKRGFATRGRVNFYNKFSWTSHGMIDYKMTAKNIIDSKELSPPKTLCLACLDAVDSAVFLIQQPNAVKNLLEHDLFERDIRLKEETLLVIDQLVVKDERRLQTDDRSADFFEGLFMRCARNGNTEMSRFFMTYLEPQKKASIVKTLVVEMLKANYRYVNLDTLLFLFNQMDVPQLDELFVENAEHVLLRFLEWPLQRHFMNLASRLWNVMSPGTFNSVLQAIVQHFIQFCSISTNPFGYRDIFRDFWLSSPAEHRSISMNELIVPNLSSLFRSHGYFNAVSNLFMDENYHQKLETLFFFNADAVLEILSNENKAKAFESIIRKYCSPNDIPPDFGKKYRVFTRKYLERYYGEVHY